MITFFFKDGKTITIDADKHDAAWLKTGLPGKDYASVAFYTTSDDLSDYQFYPEWGGWGPSQAYHDKILG